MSKMQRFAFEFIKVLISCFYYFSRDSDGYRIIRNVTSHYCACTYNYPIANIYSRHNHNIIANINVVTYCYGLCYFQIRDYMPE